MVRLIALDLEGTLISNAVSQLPRPGLRRFSELCLAKFDRIAIFTAVGRARTEAILELLVGEGSVAPELAARWEYVEWTGATKDLRFIPGVEPSECLLVDDRREYVHPGQEARWIALREYTGREDDDRELLRIEEELRRTFT